MDATRARRTREAAAAAIHPLVTIEDRSAAFDCDRIGNEWTLRHYDGPFHLLALPPVLPAISMVFVQSRDGNTGADNPAQLGGGPTDLHLIYEGLSRVAADAVMAGASTIGRRVLFSTWRPEIVQLRHDLGLPRHPSQIVVSNQGHLDLAAAIFTTPELRVFVVAGPECRSNHEARFNERPWITIIPTDGRDLRDAMTRLRRDFGINRISLVGGRTLTTAIVDAGLAQDLCLTTTAISAGEPNTPWYAGDTAPEMTAIVRKRQVDGEQIRFEHLAIDTFGGRGL